MNSMTMICPTCGEPVDSGAEDCWFFRESVPIDDADADELPFCGQASDNVAPTGRKSSFPLYILLAVGTQLAASSTAR